MKTRFVALWWGRWQLGAVLGLAMMFAATLLIAPNAVAVPDTGESGQGAAVSEPRPSIQGTGYCKAFVEQEAVRSRVRLECPYAPTTPVRGVLDVPEAFDYHTDWTSEAGASWSGWSYFLSVQGARVEKQARAGEDDSDPISISLENRTGQPVEALVKGFGMKLEVDDADAFPPPPLSRKLIPTDEALQFSVQPEHAANERGFNFQLYDLPETGGAEELHAVSHEVAGGDTILTDRMQSSDIFRLRFEVAGYGDWFKVIIERNPAANLQFVTPSVEAFEPVALRRLTGSKAKKPVYRVDVPSYIRSYEQLPNAIAVLPYSVSGVTGAGGVEQLGQLVPVAAPTIDHERKQVMFPPASFYFENVDATNPIIALRVTGFPFQKVDGRWQTTGPDWCRGSDVPPCGTEWVPPSIRTDSGLVTTLGLSDAPPPTSNALHSSVERIEVNPATSLPVERNGVSQEPLRVNIEAKGATITPENNPELANLYDFVYYRDAGTQELITGLFRSVSDGGYTAISNFRGSHVNAIPVGLLGSSAPNKAYLSTTREGTVRISAHLTLDLIDKADRGLTTGTGKLVPTSPVLGTVRGTATSGIDVANGLADPAPGAYHAYNGEIPLGQLITRYAAIPSDLLYSVNVAHAWEIEVHDGSGRLNGQWGLEQLPAVRTHLVTGTGTYIAMDELALR